MNLTKFKLWDIWFAKLETRYESLWLNSLLNSLKSRQEGAGIQCTIDHIINENHWWKPTSNYDIHAEILLIIKPNQNIPVINHNLKIAVFVVVVEKNKYTFLINIFIVITMNRFFYYLSFFTTS